MSSCAVLCHGLFAWLPQLLTRDFSKVFYTTCWQTTSPTSNQAMIGKGLPGVDLLDDIWQLIEKDASKWHDEGAYDDEGYLLEPSVDLVLVTDLYYNHTVKVLRKLGYRVWGMGDAEYLERDRLLSKNLYHELGIPVEWPVKVCEGMEELLDFVRSAKGKFYIKSGTGWRGDFETQECNSEGYIQEWVKRIRYRCGELAETMPYVIEKAIEGGIEVALDCFCVDDQYPMNCLVGCEKKDQAYAGIIQKGDARPKQLTDVYDKLGPWLRSHRARGNMSLETIIDPKKVGWPTDFCGRLGMPSGASQWATYTNMGMIAYEGAAGHLIEPEWDDPCVAEVILHTTSPEWQRVLCPRRLLPMLRLSNACRIGSDYFVMPQPAVGPNPGGLSQIGSVVATGRTIEEAIGACQEAADEIASASLDIECSASALGTMPERFKELEKVAL